MIKRKSKRLDSAGLRTRNKREAAHHSETDFELRRAVSACLLWESQFDENGIDITSRIRELVPRVEADRVASLAVEARIGLKLSHTPLLIACEMARHPSHRPLVSDTLEQVIHRIDDLTAFVEIYWHEGRVPLAKQVKKGLAAALRKFSDASLAAYSDRGPIRLRDILFLTHAKPRDKSQAELWKRLAERRPSSREKLVSSVAEKRRPSKGIPAPGKPAVHALLRQLQSAEAEAASGDSLPAIFAGLTSERVMPLYFVAAARKAPQWEEVLQREMLRGIQNHPRLDGRTILLVDISFSMEAPLFGWRGVLGADAGYGLAILLREICADLQIYSFSDEVKPISPLRGFALREAIRSSQAHLGADLSRAVLEVTGDYDRLIVITDEKLVDEVPPPNGRGFILNLAGREKAIRYDGWVHINGWSEGVVQYILAYEACGAN